MASSKVCKQLGSAEDGRPEVTGLPATWPASLLFSSWADPKEGFPGYCASTRPDWTASCAKTWPGRHFDVYAPFREGLLRPEAFEGKGRGLVSAAAVARGRAVCEMQRPLALYQYDDSRRVCEVCAHCNKFVGSLRTALTQPLASAAGAPKPEDLVDDVKDLEELESGDWAVGQRFACEDGCGAVFCSAECVASSRQEGWHRVLCTDLPPEKRQLWSMFKRHAIRHNELFILAAQVVAEIVCLVRYYEADLWVAMAFFTRFAKMSWLNMMNLPSRSHTQGHPLKGKLAELARRRREQRVQVICGALELLVGMLWERRFAELLTVDFFANLVGQFSLSNLWVEIEHPLNRKLAQRAADDPEFARRFGRLAEASSTAAREIAAPDNEEEGEVDVMPSGLQTRSWRLPRFEGSGLYVCCALSNHSCRPNFTMKFAENATAMMVALREINPGDELHLTYVSPSYSLDERLARLWKHWGFVCTCPKCQEDMMARALERASREGGQLLTPAGAAAAAALSRGMPPSPAGDATALAIDRHGDAQFSPPVRGRPDGSPAECAAARAARASDVEEEKDSDAEEESEAECSDEEEGEEEDSESSDDDEADAGFEDIAALAQRSYANPVAPRGVSPSIIALEASLRNVLASDTSQSP